MGMTANLVPGRDRAVSVVAMDGPLDARRLADHLLGREAYRRSRYAVASAGAEVAVAALTLADTEPLMSPIVDVELLAGPGETAWVEAPDVDPAVPTQLAEVARRRAPRARCVVVRGRYGHVSFVCDPQPLVVRVVDVVPPEPAKLVDQARRVLATAEDLPPIELAPDVIDLRADAAAHPRSRYLLPCRGGGELPGGAEVAYLDQRPARAEWTLLGCERSRELHRWFYGDLPEVIDFCPKVRRPVGSEPAPHGEAPAPGGHGPAPDGHGPTLMKCCRLEQGVEALAATSMVVPWGASLAEVRAALDHLVVATEPAWAPA